MADAARRQRKLAAKVARRKEVVAAKRKLETASASLPARIRLAAKGRIVSCLVPTNLFDNGIGHVIVARALPTGLLGCAYFLVDVFCLGVKDAFYTETSERDLKARVEMHAEMQTFAEAPPAMARKLVRDSMAYAAGFGLPPADDAAIVETIFGDVNADDCTDSFTFGKDGKPFFLNGPNDSPARIRMIMRTLEQAAGPGGWDYIVGMQPPLPE